MFKIPPCCVIEFQSEYWLRTRKVFQFVGTLDGRALENNRHFATPSLVSTRNDVLEKSAEIP